MQAKRGRATQKVAERRADGDGQVIGLAAAVSALQLGPQRGGASGRGCGRGRGSKPAAKKAAKITEKIEDKVEETGDSNSEEPSPASDQETCAEAADKKIETSKANAKPRRTSKGKGTASKGEKAKKKRSFPKSHLVDEWKKFLKAEREKLQGKLTYHEIMKQASEKPMAQVSSIPNFP